MRKLSGRIAVVTGGRRGIGRSIVEAFAAEGADIAIVDVAAEELAAPAMEAVRAAGRRGLYVQADVSNEDQVRGMTTTVLSAFGRIDILVNDAGVFSQHLLHEMPVKEWDRVVGINLRGTFLCTRFILPGMLEQGSGAIVNIASQLGQIGGTEMVHYSASKGGVIAFTKALAREVSKKGVRVNAIAPGPILTDMMADETDDWRDAKLAELPMGRFGEVYEVAPTAVFLASDDASYYVGQTLGPNGGDVML